MGQSGFSIILLYSGLSFLCGSFSLNLGLFYCRSLLSYGSLYNGLFGLQFLSILCNNLHRNLNENLLVEVNSCYIVADLLGITHGDDFAVNFLAKLLELLSNLSSTY